ncbi:MAG: DUF1573 domain-containing protein [Sphingobacteriales bacterium]|nr:MAG: DUF1573 domain-containing protein [Sphingobacteriales bacterium]
MKKILLGLITILAIIACKEKVKNQEVGVNSENATTINFSKEIFDFGKITQGDTVVNAFEFTNTGKIPLIITNAVASCGCTLPNWPKEPIKPGDTGKINVVFNSTGKKGLQDKVITITANTNPAQNKVHLIGEVLKNQNEVTVK